MFLHLKPSLIGLRELRGNEPESWNYTENSGVNQAKLARHFRKIVLPVSGTQKLSSIAGKAFVVNFPG